MDGMVRAAVDALIASLGTLTPEQLVHATLARRLADLVDGDAPAYGVAALSRQLTATLASLTGKPDQGRGIAVVDLDRLFGELR